MDTFVKVTKSAKSEVYEEIIPQIESLLHEEKDLTANLANTAAVLKMSFPHTISWVGFYLLKDGELVLGPFQGKPACVRIQMGKGVCGKAASDGKTIIVPNVEEFPGHIYCDPDSRSEIVVPVLLKEKVVCVLDVDSPSLGTFEEIDRINLEKIVGLLKPSFNGSNL